MKKFIHNLLDRAISKLTVMANEAQAAADLYLIGNILPLSAEGKRVQLSPYGDFPHKKGLQRLDRASAEKMVANCKAQRTAQGSNFAGFAWYVGHPDVPEIASQYPDTKAYGWIKDLEAGDDGLYGNVEWTDAGRALFENKAYKFFSPVWFCQPGADGAMRPARFKSAGFTNTPNIPVQPLANDQPQTTDKGTTMPQWLIDLLKVGKDSTEEQLILLVQGGIDAKAQLVTQANDHKNALANIEQTKTKAENDLKVERDAHIATKGLVTTERTARADLAIANAIREGRITPADKDGVRTELLANDAKFVELANKKAVIKTTPVATGLNNRGESPKAMAQIRTKVSQRMRENPTEDYDTAFANVKRENGELFAGLKQPEPFANS